MTRARRGITLTEILMAILILGVGMASLFTLFPLGMLRIRDAQRLSRSATFTESATGDAEARDVLNKMSFLNPRYSPWYSTSTAFYTPAATPRAYDPWVQDTPTYRGDPWSNALGFGAYRGSGPPATAPFNNTIGFIAGPGLPVAYDPLWRQQTGFYPGEPGDPEARFGSGLGYVRTDPDGKAPSAHGLQRVTNFSPYVAFGYPPYGTPGNPPNIDNTAASVAANAVPSIFVSPEDVVLQSNTDEGQPNLSPIVPDLSFPVDGTTKQAIPQHDWKYTWMFTGQQSDCTNGTVFTGDVVVFENRPFSVDPATAPLDSKVTSVVAGEPVVEAIFGYTSKVTTGAVKGAERGYGLTANRAVLLRWPNTIPDPEVKVGNWIADVTYERNATLDVARRYTDADNGVTGGAGAYYPYQRCYWYQIAKRTEPRTGQAFDGDPSGVAYREMVVWTSAPLRAFTLLSTTSTIKGSPVHVNAALVSPYVVNVFPRTFYTR